MRKRNIFIIVSLFIVFLVSSRLLWIKYFQQPDHPVVIDGQLDLQAWNNWEKGTIMLDGEWEFYPNQWLLGEKKQDDLENRQIIQVPEGWNSHLEADVSTPYGYGAYRLQILVDPDDDLTYSLWVPSVRSASELYVNNKLLSSSGKVGENIEEYIAENIPYSAVFTADETGLIDIVIQAANFKDTRDGGIIRSIQFGTAEKVAQETNLSISLQQLVAIVFMINAIYALILYLISNRDQQLLLYYSLFMGSMTFSNLIGSDNKLLHVWFPINYEWGFKLVHLFLGGISFSLLQLIKYRVTKFWEKVIRFSVVISGILILLSLILSANHLLIIQPLYSLVSVIAIFSAAGLMIYLSFQDSKDNILILLSLIALTHNLAWWGFFGVTGIKIIYYPFDLIIAMIFFASVWFKRYTEAHKNTEKLAIQLQEEHKLKDEFIANTSHELRNPLHSIINILKAFSERERYSLSEESFSDLKTVQAIGNHMSLTLDDLLEAMHLKGEDLRVNLQNIRVEPIATGVIDMLNYMVEGKPVQLINKIPDDFPYVKADENRIIQIMFNLLHNALKHTKEGKITIQAFEKNGKAKIVVSDTGIGMDKKTLSQIFTPYKQGNHEQMGVGLGLSISKQLIELHGGTLTAHSVLGEGTEFHFTLQLANEKEINTYSDLSYQELASTSSLENSITSSSEQLVENKPRLLVVDDDTINLKVIEMILTNENYEITGVTSGEAALQLLNKQEWDLIITDIMMPNISGYELTREVRKQYTMTELPILLLSARGQPLDIEYGFLSGANDYVIKPVDDLEMKSRVKALTEVKQAVRKQLQMEAVWLQAQIQPHFLFNTLNAITALSTIDLDKMRTLIDEFAFFLRSKFKFEVVDELKPLEEELSIIRSYLYIQKVRFDERLNVVWDIDEGIDLEKIKVPLLTIQPIIENAVYHGIMKRIEGGTITIGIARHKEQIKISVKDDGIGMEQSLVDSLLDRSSATKSGIGLSNTDLRLKRRYGKGLTISSRVDKGTTVSFFI